MSRTLAHGRLTKVDPGEAIRKAGFTAAYGDNAPPGAHMDQLIFESAGYEYILGSAAQVGADVATITWDQAQQRFEDKAGSLVTLDDYDRVAVVGMDTLTADIVIDNVVGLKMWHIGNTPGQSGDNPKFDLGDSGGGVPYKIVLGSGTSGCKLDLQTTTDFRSLVNFTQSSASALEPYKARYIANQGVRNQITVNDNQIFNPCRAGEIVKLDTHATNPYYLRLNGQVFPFANGAGVAGQTWFRDLNIALDGYRWNGSAFVESSSRFTSVSSPYLSQANTANRFFTDISALDARVNIRSDPNGVSIAATAAFVSGTNIVTFSGGAGNIKNNMRINGADAQGVPSGLSGTTVLRNIDTAAGTAEMWGNLSMVPINATATIGGIAVTMDNSGSAGGSIDDDFLQNITGSFGIRGIAGTANTITANESGVFSKTIAGGSTSLNGLTSALPTENFDLISFDATNSPGARTHTQTQPLSSGAYYYYRV